MFYLYTFLGGYFGCSLAERVRVREELRVRTGELMIKAVK